MNPQERDIINGIFDRLKQAEGQPRDADVEALIDERLRAQPGAAYFLAQIVHVQEQALANLNDRVNALEAEVAQAKAAPAAGGGFLASLFGASTPPNQQLPKATSSGRPLPQQGNRGPWNAQSQSQQPQAAGPWGNRGGASGGFLATAMTTAAGVAGGMMLGSALTNAFGLNGGADKSASDQAASANQATAEPAAQDTADASYADPTYQEATYDEGLDGGFDDFGGGDDWI
ncbi:DUF2076 domain-containing protein [Pseudochelatococcus sp. G4_1912]|uniref:DUF2076 domain-containing protein n=1 Tax=Pseudochelatococcus sp. G4_1912 TaxID=3114288 RepID=UPI0039C5DD8F